MARTRDVSENRAGAGAVGKHARSAGIGAGAAGKRAASAGAAGAAGRSTAGAGPGSARAALRSRKVDDRLAAVGALAEDSSPAAAELLIEAVGDASGLVAARAIRALGRLFSDGRRPPQAHAGLAAMRERAAGAIIERYWHAAAAGKKSDPGCLVRIEAVRVLGEWRVPRAAEVFFDAVQTVQVERSGHGLEDVAIPLRVQAAAALASVRPRGALLALSVLLFDDDPRVETVSEDRPYRTLAARTAAARALAALGDPGGAAILGVKLSRPAGELPEVLAECMEALKRLDEEAAFKVVPPYLRSPDPFLAASAATALASLSKPYHGAVLERLLQALVDRLDDARPAIALAIASMRCDEAVAALCDLASRGDAPVALEAVKALAERRDAPAIEALKAIARESGDRLVRACARDALGRL